MLRSLFTGLLIASSPLAIVSHADAQTSSVMSDRPQNRIGQAVELRALDKVTARTFDYTVTIGESLDFGSLTIHARHCETTPPTELPETYAFLQIDDKRLDGSGEESEEDERIFSGWMFKSRPAISALDHRVYDVWVIGCVLAPLRQDPPDSRRPDRL